MSIVLGLLDTPLYSVSHLHGYWKKHKPFDVLTYPIRIFIEKRFFISRLSIHIAVVQSTIPTNQEKFTMNISTVFTFCTKNFMMALCSREYSIIISIKVVTEITIESACTGPWRLTGGSLETQGKPLLPPLARLQQELL